MSLDFTNKLPKLNELNLEQNQNSNTYDKYNIKTSPNKWLYIRKLNDEDSSKGEINKAIYDSFNNPEKYFSEYSPISVGKKIKIKKIELPPYKQGKFLSKKSLQKRFSISMAKLSDANKSYLGREKQNNNNNYEVIEYNTLKSIFDNYRNNYNHNKHLKNKEISFLNNLNPLNKSSNNSISNFEQSYNLNTYKKNNINFPYNLYRSLDYQNKQINYKKMNDKKVASLSKFISKKINKHEDDLLINKVDLFNYKKEIIGEINRDKTQEGKYGKLQWNISLRRPNNFRGIRDLHVNISTDKNPFWGIIVERNPNPKELAIRPGYNLNRKEFINFEQNENIQKNKVHLNNIKNLDELKVKGSNLFNLEYNREMSTKGRKILHKAFVENGKTILNKDINKIFGEETFYKNYENKKNYNYNLSSNNICNEHNIFEGENVHYKFGAKQKTNRIITSNSRSFDNSRNNLNTII